MKREPIENLQVEKRSKHRLKEGFLSFCIPAPQANKANTLSYLCAPAIFVLAQNILKSVEVSSLF